MTKQFYVYVLSRPDGSPFYVGMGQGRRIHDHEMQARSGHNCKKCELIREIWTQGGQVQRSVIFTTNDRDQAMAFEIETIARYGRENLCNRSDGGYGARGYSLTLEERAKKSAANKRRYELDPGLRQRISKAVKATKSTPEARERTREAAKTARSTPESRAKTSRINTDRYADPEARKKQSRASKEALSRPEVRRKISTKLKTRWSDPEYRAQRNAANKTTFADPVVLARRNAAIKAAFADPETRTKLSDAMKASWARRKAAKQENNAS